MKPANTITLRLSAPAMGSLAPFLGTGVGIETVSGITLIELLCDQLGIAFDYIDQRVQTIFVNGKAVDRIDQVHIQTGDIIALSAAMPGLAGATLRKGGTFAALRKEISHTDTTVPTRRDQKAWVTLKLFNLVAKELCAHLLFQGVWVNAKQIAMHFRQLDSPHASPLVEVRFNDRPITIETLLELCGPEDRAFVCTTHTRV